MGRDQPEDRPADTGGAAVALSGFSSSHSAAREVADIGSLRLQPGGHIRLRTG